MLIEVAIIVFGLLFTSGITLLIPVGHGYHYWSPFLLLIGGYLLGVALMWIILSIFASFFPKDKEYDKPNKLSLFLLKSSVTYICNHALARIKVKGDKNLPKEKFLMVCNHRSKFDPMLMCKLYGNIPLVFVSKPTNFKIPLGGHFMKASCYLSIDRFDKLKSLEVMKKAGELIQNDYASVGIFPEGTRSESSDLLPFHEGVFAVAKRVNAPIVITTIKGTELIKDNFKKLKRTKIEFEILKILYPTDYNELTPKQISDNAHELMLENLGH